jgi:hypothetical protein
MPDSELATVVPVTSRKRRKHSSLTSVSEQEKLPTKRKLNLGELDSDSSGLAELDISMLDADFSTLYSSEELDRVLVGEKDHGLNDFISISVDDYQPDGSGLPHLPITSTETENIPPTPNALDFCSTLHGSLYKFVHILITLSFLCTRIFILFLFFFFRCWRRPCW